MILNLINYILILMHRCRNMLLIANKVMQLCVVQAALQRLTAVNQAVNNCSWGCYDTCRRRLWLGGSPGAPSIFEKRPYFHQLLFITTFSPHFGFHTKFVTSLPQWLQSKIHIVLHLLQRELIIKIYALAIYAYDVLVTVACEMAKHLDHYDLLDTSLGAIIL